MAESGETSPVSGVVTAVNKGEISIRNGRPYLISPGTMLQIDSGALVLRGDLLATLVFEREKTGDIVQGLPKVEELLEGRKPKDCAILAEYDGTAKLKLMMTVFQDCSWLMMVGHLLKSNMQLMLM